jgi:hypothetical protein
MVKSLAERAKGGGHVFPRARRVRSKTIQIYTTNPALLESEMVTTLTHSLQVTVVAIDYFVQPLGMVVKRWLPPRLICEIMCRCTKGA